MNTVQIVQKHLNKNLRVEGVVLTMFDGRTNLSIQVVEEVKSISEIRYIVPSFRGMFALVSSSHGLYYTV